MIPNKILIVDDSLASRMIIRRCLELSGLRNAGYMEADNGETALNLVGTFLPDLIVTDLNMPVLDGKGLIRALRAVPATEKIPVIVTTSLNNHALEKELAGLHISGVIQKPLTPQKFLSLMGAPA